MNQPRRYGGFCATCKTEHLLSDQRTTALASELIFTLEQQKSIVKDEPRFSTAFLFGPARGQMFGLMLTIDLSGTTQIIKAFSGQYNGQYQVAGWVPPVFDVEEFQRLNDPEEKRIKALTRQLTETTDIQKQQQLKQQRRHRSQELMKKIHDLYRLKNFKGEERPMSTFFPQDRGMPTGAGDCCAPKLLHYAVTHNLKPLGLSEFYFGLGNKSGTKKHGEFYSSCTANCAPILGFMLCGL